MLLLFRIYTAIRTVATLAILPENCVMISERKLFIFEDDNLPDTNPYVPSSAIINGTSTADGIPEIAKLITGLKIPAIKPARGPHANPANSTGKCIGNNILPVMAPAPEITPAA